MPNARNTGGENSPVDRLPGGHSLARKTVITDSQAPWWSLTEPDGRGTEESGKTSKRKSHLTF